MDRLAFNAAASINEMRLARQQLSHEMANINTNGFKKSYEVAMVAHKASGQGFDSRFQPLAVPTDLIQLKSGPLIATGRDLDILMNNSTVLGVTAENGELAFTRRGDLRLNNSGALETSLGQLIRNEEGGNVTIPPGFMARIADDGTVFATDPTQPGVPQQVPVGRLLLRDASQTPLRRREDGLFRVDGQPSGTDFATGPEQASLTVRALEGSNVNPMEAMVKMIEHSRAFEQQVKIIKDSTENDQAGAAMMKLP